MKHKNFTFKKLNILGLYPESKKNLDKDFLTWFMGFFEADGCFSRDGRVNITQISTDIQVLYKIRTRLGFGVVRPHNVPEGNCFGTHRWITKVDVKQAAFIAILFNGHLVGNQKLSSFKRWYEFWYKRREFRELIGYGFKLQKEPNFKLMSLSNSWLSGFIDGDGCYGITIYKTASKVNPSKSMRLRIACQSDPEWVEKAIEILGIGRRDPKNSDINLSLTVEKHNDIEEIIEYHKMYPLKTRKHIALGKFVKVRRRILKKEHYGLGYDRIKSLSSQINVK